MFTDEQMFDFLDRLRESGEVNMFGARPYLIDMFDLPPLRAAEVHQRWMRTYHKRHPEPDRRTA